MSWFSVERPIGRIAAQVVAFGFSRGVLLLCSILTARAAGVNQYGVFALALVVFQGGILLRDGGLGQALIVLGGRERGLTLPASIAIGCLGIALGALMRLFAEPLASALGVEGAAAPLGILALAFAVGSLGIASNATLERELRFVSRAVIDAVSYGTLGVVTVTGLMAGSGIEALAWGFVAQAAVQAALGIGLAPPWRDRGGSLAGLVRVATYSSLLWASAGLSYLAANIDNALIGRLSGASALGVYALAYSIGSTITIGIAQVLNRVALPYYSRGHVDPSMARRTAQSVIPLSVVLAAIPTTLIIALGPEIGRLVFDPGTSILPVTILAVYGLVRSLGMSLGTVLNGVGAARETVVGSAMNVCLMAVMIPAALSLAGPAGVAAVVLLAIAVSSAYLVLGLKRRVGLGLESTVRWIALGTTCAVVAAIVVPGLATEIRLIIGTTVTVSLVVIALRITGSRLFPSAPGTRSAS